jgi:hypothetical protein
MESPAGAGKFMNRTRMYLNDFIANHLDESHVKRSLLKLSQTQTRPLKNIPYDNSSILQRAEAHQKILMILTKMQEPTLTLD